MNLYLTADRVGTPTGGGLVTYHELEAFKGVGPCVAWSASELGADPKDPWRADRVAWGKYRPSDEAFGLCHVYAGTFTHTVRRLKETGCKVSYTAAAHSVEDSRREHELLGLPFDYPHLTDPEQWKQYLGGYLDADILVVPSSHSQRVMCAYGANPDRIVRIPHGVAPPARERIRPQPKRFTVGYLGAYGPDKGVLYLLQAWKKLGYRDAVLRLAGRDSTSPFVRQMVSRFGGGNVELVGWVDAVADFYGSLSLYVQPSVTEGFGIEVLEAMSCGVSVICSDGCGASELLARAYDPPGCTFPARDVDELCKAIEEDREGDFDRESVRQACLEVAEQHSWENICNQYTQLWREMTRE